MTLRLILTDGSGVQGLSATFGAVVQTNIIQTSVDAAAAAASALAAANSATAAGTSASNAAGSASNAANSATAAANSATAAGGSATSAGASASNAAASATAAGNSATAAAGSATAAGTSATNAANSATAAATSASNAAATLANALTKANNLSDVASVTTARTNLGLGTAATQNTGVSGGVVPLLNGTNTWANAQTFSASPQVPTATPGDSSLNASSTAFVAAALAPMTGKNRIINGDCRVAQRGNGVYSTGVAGYGGPDRYYAINANSAGGQFTQSQGSITIGGITKSAVVQTVNTAIASVATTNIWSGITQSIEGLNCYDLLGQQAAISFIFSTNLTGTNKFSLALRDYTNANSYVTSFNATGGTPVKVSIPLASLPTSLTTPNSAAGGLSLSIAALNQGTYQTATVGSWQSGNFVSASGAANWGATVGNFIAATEIQLEAGSFSTTFDRRQYGTELALCQRYYQTNAAGMVYGYANAAGVLVYADGELPVPMRASPTTGLGTISYANASAYLLTALGNSAFRMQITVSTAGTAYGYVSSGVNTFAAEL